jgi:aquaporin Z
MIRKLVVEGIGTFFLVFTVGMVVIDPGAGALAPHAIGAALMIMVYAGGHISGGHYNPAVTLAVLLRGRASGRDLIGYWLTQVAGALVAAVAVGYLKGDAPVAALAPPLAAAALAELLFTFALCYVVLNTATTRGTEGNSYFGLAIGFTVTVGAYAVGGISGAAFNPAVAVGVVVLGLAEPGMLLVYFVAQLAGAAAAGVLFNALDLGDDKATTATPAEQAALRPAASTDG